jgi:hypothetical protein
MTIRFCPWWLGFSLGNMLYVLGCALLNGSEANVDWGRILVIAPMKGLIAAALFVVVQSVVGTKKRGSARVRLW